jgi:hypothetical protein
LKVIPNNKIKRYVIIHEYEEGGLKRPHIQSFSKALKMSWLHKLLDTFNHSPWKLHLLGDMQKWGGINILYLSKYGLENVYHLFVSKGLTIWAG